jgi:parallel beta-helix repeat protein/predicted outer membrane repeat protein
MREGLLILMIMMLLVSLSFGADFYVNAVNGSDSKTGTSTDNAWQTITYALTRVSGSVDNPITLNIEKGTYDINIGESFPLVMKNFVNIKGSERETTILDATGANATVITFAESVDNVFIKGVTIKGGNNPSSTGGGVYCYYASPSISDCLIKENIAKNGAGIYVMNSKITLQNSTVTNNTKASDGSGMYMIDSTPTIRICKFLDNIATSNGGGIYCLDSTPKISRTQFSNNNAQGLWGGAIFLNKSNAQIDSCQITGNTASNGGGIYSNFSGPTITDCTFTENTGGALYFQDSTYSTVTNCIIDNNQAYDGGGIYYDNTSDFSVLSNCRIEGNIATNFGGGLNLLGSSPKMTNVLISGNKAKTGGGIYFNASSPTLGNVTFANNIGSVDGTAMNLFSTSAVTLINSIIWGADIASLITQTAESQLNMTYSDVEVDFAGQGNKKEDPAFAKGPLGDYYLSQIDAGQASTSICVDNGSDTAANLSLDTLTTRTDKVTDSGQVDMGYHYPSTGSADEILFELKLNPDAKSFSQGDNFNLLLDLKAPAKNTPIDLYFVLLNVNTNVLYFGLLWDMTPVAVLKNFTLPANFTLSDATIMNIKIPSQKPPISDAVTYTFAIGATKPGTLDFISNIATTSFVLN